MMRTYSRYICIMFVAILAAACSKDDKFPADNINWHIRKVAVVLPMNDGLDEHWKQTLDMAASNMKGAFSNQEEGIQLSFEWYDENTIDVKALSKELAGREDIAAVIGGVYSSNAQSMASALCLADKPFFTLATAEELVRACTSSGSLWAMTETDITQCEVLLTKALYYGAKSVSLIASEEDAYGQTFIDWFAFQAKELGLEVKGIYGYTSSSLKDASGRAAQSGADYLICVPSEIKDIKDMLEACQQKGAPRTLFSDTAFGADVISTVGTLSEGLEGVAFGANPESGFEVSYETFFGRQSTLGEAQVYDAAMLIGYAAYYQLLTGETEMNEALCQVVSGRDSNMGNWMEEGMRLVVDAMKQGKHPDIKGASGALDFDSKVYTNVLGTTYYNYLIYNGKYVILDFNTSDGSKRTDATLAGWNWKAAQMQEFDESESGISYPALDERWALLVAGSKGWSNYRHQADVLNMYRILKSHGYTDDHIVLVMEDDIAYNEKNTEPGVVRVQNGGGNVYENVHIDYHTSDLKPTDIADILCGNRSDKLPEVIGSDSNDNVLVFWSGHGSPGQFCWLDDESGFSSSIARSTFTAMSDKKGYRKLLCLIETCYSGSVMKETEGIPGLLAFTAADTNETSKADVFSQTLHIWLSNRFSSTLHDCITNNPDISLRDLYYRLFINTIGSHVCVYNAENYGNIYKESMTEWM